MAQTSSKFIDRNKILVFDFDPDSADPVDVSFEDFRDYEYLVVLAIRTIGTGALDGFRILGNSDSAGGDTDVVLKTHAVGSEPNLIPDFLVLSVSSSEMAQEGSDASPEQTDLRYVSANLELATNTDEFIIVYIFANAKHPTSGLTADTIQ